MAGNAKTAGGQHGDSPVLRFCKISQHNRYRSEGASRAGNSRSATPQDRHLPSAYLSGIAIPLRSGKDQSYGSVWQAGLPPSFAPKSRITPQKPYWRAPLPPVSFILYAPQVPCKPAFSKKIRSALPQIRSCTSIGALPLTNKDLRCLLRVRQKTASFPKPKPTHPLPSPRLSH